MRKDCFKNLTVIMLTSIITLALLFSPMSTLNASAASSNLIINKVVEPTDEARVYKVTYTVQSMPVEKDVDIVLVLDRSNSMLYPDGEGGLVVDHVREAALNFVSTVFKSNPNSRIAVVDYGTSAVINNNGNFSSSESKVKDIINERLKVIPYKRKKSDYTWYRWGYSQHWAYHDPYDGATNIKDAFDNASWIMKNKARDESKVDRAIILFTDGVATRGGDYYDRNIRAYTHNSNTIAAYNAGLEAQKNADVVTVGYFNGIADNREKDTAIDTLKKAQNAGFYNAPSLNELNNIFDTISSNLNYIGTNAVVSDLLTEGFEIVPNSFEPSNAIVSTSNISNQNMLNWEIGTLGDNTYELSYKIRVKDDAYPTGIDRLPVSTKTELNYLDIDDKMQTEEFDNSYVTIPPIDGFPKVTINNTYSSNGYLVGDIIQISNELSFNYSLPFEFTLFEGEVYKKKLSNGSLSTDFTFIGPGDLWTVTDNDLTYLMNTYDITNQNSWMEDINLEIQCNTAGTFEFKHDVMYTLTDIYGKKFEQAQLDVQPEIINVKEGSISVKVVDNYGLGIKDVDIVINDVLQPVKTNDSGDFTVSKLKTGSYDVEVDIPSGYVVDSSVSGITITPDNKVKFTVNLNYDNAEQVKEIRLINSPFKDVKVLSLDDEADVYTNDYESFDAKVEFTTIRSFEELTLMLNDNIVDGDISVQLDKVTTKVGGTEKEVNGFAMGTGNGIVYTPPTIGDELVAGSYTAYIKITPPSSASEPAIPESNPWFKVDVPTILAATSSSPVVPYAINGDQLNVWYDDEAPIIVLTPDTLTWTKMVNVTADISSLVSPVVDYKCAKGKHDIDFFNKTENTPLINDFNTIDNSDVHNIIGTFIVKSQLEPGDENKDGVFVGNDEYTVYAKDKAGNESVKTIRISNIYTTLPDLTYLD